MSTRSLIAGLGNVFFGDDGFGVEVVRRLRSLQVPEGVAVEDYGIRGVHLAFRLLEPLDLLLVADAVARGGTPGTLYLLEPDFEPPSAAPAEGHGMVLPSVFSSVRAMGASLPRVRIVGCEPADVSEKMSLSEPVSRAVAPAIDLVLEIVQRDLKRPESPREVVL